MVKISFNFSWISHHFDVKFVCLAESDHINHPPARPLARPWSLVPKIESCIKYLLDKNSVPLNFQTFLRSWSQAMQRNETNYRAKLSVNHKIMEKLHYELIHRFKVEKLSTYTDKNILYESY